MNDLHYLMGPHILRVAPGLGSLHLVRRFYPFQFRPLSAFPLAFGPEVLMFYRVDHQHASACLVNIVTRYSYWDLQAFRSFHMFNGYIFQK